MSNPSGIAGDRIVFVNLLTVNKIVLYLITVHDIFFLI